MQKKKRELKKELRSMENFTTKSAIFAISLLGIDEFHLQPKKGRLKNVVHEVSVSEFAACDLYTFIILKSLESVHTNYILSK